MNSMRLNMKQHQLLHAVLASFLLLVPRVVPAAGNSAPKSLTSEVLGFKGTPALYVNGKLTSQILAAPAQRAAIFMAMAETWFMPTASSWEFIRQRVETGRSICLNDPA